jgi:hypothetical protein
MLIAVWIARSLIFQPGGTPYGRRQQSLAGTVCNSDSTLPRICLGHVHGAKSTSCAAASKPHTRAGRDVLVGRNVAESGDDEPMVVPGRICVDLGRLLAELDIGSCWSAGIAAKGDQQVYPLSSETCWSMAWLFLEGVLHLLTGILQAGLSLIRPAFVLGVVIAGGLADCLFGLAAHILDLVLQLVFFAHALLLPPRYDCFLLWLPRNTCL